MTFSPTQHRFLRACRLQPVDVTPVWFMRQAGRYMKEYREIRKKNTILDICRNPALAAEVTLQPMRKLGVDAAILFADILLAVAPMGIEFEFSKDEGPVIKNPVKTAKDVAALRIYEPEEELFSVMETLHILRRELEYKAPIIGFAGAPFTLASYLIEGGHSRNYIKTKSMMYAAPKLWGQFMDKLARVTTAYLRGQIRAGAQAVQLFDSWIGCLSPYDYETYVLPFAQQVIRGLKKDNIAAIYFGTETSMLLELMNRSGAGVIGVDWRIPLDQAWARLGPGTAVQGNLDPAALFGPPREIRKRVEDVLRRAAGRPGHIFNLGHGILPNTPVGNVKAVVDMVHEYSPPG
ncbi:MAG: uroporphyrinogen decarboxylase [Elusimicrobia bacterium]|nr:uroporphyrinogen decarboxylase [Elusimicrobiota bacterium]